MKSTYQSLAVNAVLISTSLGLVVMLLGCLFASSSAIAQEEPSFDCERARTAVERSLCVGGNSGMGWLDQTMAALYKAVLAGSDVEAMRSSQRLWLAQRNKCSGSEMQVMNCVSASYRARFATIAAPYDPAHLTGRYTDDKINGVMDTALFPDRTLAVSVSSSRGAPSYNMCDVTFRALFEHDELHYIEPADSGSDPNAPHCSIDLTLKGATFTVKQSGCEDMCGANTDFAGSYKRTP
jgi:uncharacterized protein